MVVAQTDPISGGAGWVGAGLLGLVLAWLLLKHLPDKDRMIREILKEHDAEVKEIVAGFQGQLDRARGEYVASLKYVADKSEQVMKEQVAALHREFERLEHMLTAKGVARQ